MASTQPMTAPKPITLFVCCAPEDEALRKELEKHLTLLERQGYITSWAGAHVGAGEEGRAEVDRRMSEARVILLLVSADFLASDHLYDVELQRALACGAKGARVLGVLLRPSDWQHGALRSLEMLPQREGVATPVTEWSSRDAAFKAVAERLRETLREWGYTSRISINPSEARPKAAPSG
jgi:hypothetical protein